MKALINTAAVFPAVPALVTASHAWNAFCTTKEEYQIKNRSPEKKIKIWCGVVSFFKVTIQMCQATSVWLFRSHAWSFR